MVAAVDWTNVLVALIAGLPAIIGAIYSGRVHRQIRTPSGPSIGKQVEHANVSAIANNQLLSAIHGNTKAANGGDLQVGAPSPLAVPADEPEP